MRTGANLAAMLLPDRQDDLRIRSWDTPYTALLSDGTASPGMGLTVFEPLTPGDAGWLSYVNTIKTKNAQGATGSDATVSADAEFFDPSVQPRVLNGVTPTASWYWAAGAPNWWGVTTSGRCSVRIAGQVHSSSRLDWLGSPSTVTFAVAGSGFIRIESSVGGNTTVLFEDEVREGNFLEQGFVFSAPVSITGLPTIKVFYLQTGNEAWGGFTIKVLTGSVSATTANAQSLAAAAPVLGAGFMSVSAPVSANTWSYIRSATITEAKGEASRVEVDLPLINPAQHDGSGWMYYRADLTQDPGSLRMYDAGTVAFTLKRKRLVQVEQQVPNAQGVPTTWIPLFTGFVDDWSVSAGVAKVTFTGIEARLVEQREQLPDRISYMNGGFKTTTYNPNATATINRKEPIYNVPAFDNWPLSVAVEEIGVRAGVDPSRYRKTRQVVRQDSTVVTLSGVLQFQAKTPSGAVLRLPRPTNYGNFGLGFVETQQPDDGYLFPVEPTQDLWARVRDLTDKLGYRYYFDGTGFAVLQGSALPDAVADFVTGDATVGTAVSNVNANAYGATYLSSTGIVTLSKTVTAARIDLSMPQVLGAGSWAVTVRLSGTPVATLTVTNGGTSPTPICLFNTPVLARGTNSTITTLFSGDYNTYTVELVGSTATPRFADCLLLYYTDPDSSRWPAGFTTATTAISVDAVGQQDATRNKITIVGSRKGSVTDSQKFAEAQQRSGDEFVVENAVDVASIVDPTAQNFVGYQKHAIIYDEKIGDNGFARYLAQTFIHRQRVPRVGARLQVPLNGVIEKYDALPVEETTFGSVTTQQVVYVSRVQHLYENNRTVTTVEGEPWADFPAYAPRTDIDISLFGNVPYTGKEVSYTSLSGHSLTNPTKTDVVEATEAVVTQTLLTVTTVGGRPALALPGGTPWPPLPGTVQIKPSFPSVAMPDPNTLPVNGVVGTYLGTVGNTTMRDAPAGTTLQSFVVPAPLQYVGLYYQTYQGGQPTSRRVTLTTSPADRLYIRVSNSTATGAAQTVVELVKGAGSFPYVGDDEDRTAGVNVYLASYDRGTYDYQPYWVGNNPYHHFIDIDYRDGQRYIYLPYQQADVSFDNSQGALPHKRSPEVTSYDVRYRVLSTTSGGTFTDPYAGKGTDWSPFYDPYTSELGYLVKIKATILSEGRYRIAIRSTSDDSVVAFLTAPSNQERDERVKWQYLPIGNYEWTWDGVDQLGDWNTKQSALYQELTDSSFGEDSQRIGRGFYVWNQELSGDGLGPMAYIWMKRNAATGKPEIGQGTFASWYVSVEAETDDLAAPYRDGVSAKETQLIHTHLPNTTQLEVKLEDWGNDSWTSGGVQDQFGFLSTTTPGESTVAAYIHNQKPVRMRFRVAPRPGALWVGREQEVGVKLTREVHLTAMIADQSVVYHGVAYPNSTRERQTILNRLYTNQEHTLQYTDANFRKARQFRWVDGDAGSSEWVFIPSQFKKQFRVNGLVESLRFGDYLQLEEVPGYSPTRGANQTQGRLNLALMSYLFYFSAYVTDRSGRSAWGINRSFLDMSKLTRNSYGSWRNPDDPTLAATSVTYRNEWSDDPYLLKRAIYCRQWTKEPNWRTNERTRLGFSANTAGDNLLEHFWWQHDPAATTLGTSGTLWTSFGLTADSYWANHVSSTPADARAPSRTINKQLGFMSGANPIHQLNGTSGASPGNWTWETGPVWIPDLTRDFHGFHKTPPMSVPALKAADWANWRNVEVDMRQINCFAIVDSEQNDYNRDTRTGADVAAVETWSSPVFAMQYVTDGTYTASRRRFWPNRKVDFNEWPGNLNRTQYFNVSSFIDYQRQWNVPSYEAFRGMISRQSRPGEQPVRSTPEFPYYLNAFTYDHLASVRAKWNPAYPRVHTHVTNWFRYTFRHEYQWESPGHFPVTQFGKAWLAYTYWWRARYDSGRPTNLRYDYGAWVGWKDDLVLPYTPVQVAGTTSYPAWLDQVRGWSWVNKDEDWSVLGSGGVFSTNFMAVGVGPVLPQTTQVCTHLILVDARRGSAIA